MMAHLLIVGLISFYQGPISLEDTEIYTGWAVSIYKLKQKYVACSSIRNELVLFDSKEVKKIYNLKGKAPSELEDPFVLGVKNQKIYIGSGMQRILVFDENLNLLTERYASFSNLRLWSGRNVNGQFIGDQTLLLTCILNPSTLIWCNIGERDSKVLVTRLPQKSIAEPGFGYQHRDSVFVSKHYIPADEYRVSVLPLKMDYNKAPDLQMENALIGDLTSFEKQQPSRLAPAYSALLHIAFKYKFGYIVMFTAKEPGEKDKQRYYDHFNLEGRFLKRSNLKGIHLIPVTNADEFFTFDEEQQALNAYPFTAP